MNNKFEMTIAAGLLALTVTSAGYAQRTPAYQNARDGGLVGEKTNGYLGAVVAPSPAIKALMDDINIKRKEAYTKEAQTSNIVGATVEAAAFVHGCKQIADTAVGEKYQTPDGSWATRTSASPALSANCPK